MLGDGLNEEVIWKNLQPFFEDRNIQIITNDAKGLILWLDKLDIAVAGLGFDAQIGAYLLEPTRNKYEVEQLL